jgi:hypothetical protein
MCVNTGKYSTLNISAHFAVIFYAGRIFHVANIKITANFAYQSKVVPADIRFVIQRLLHFFFSSSQMPYFSFPFLHLKKWS